MHEMQFVVPAAPWVRDYAGSVAGLADRQELGRRLGLGCEREEGRGNWRYCSSATGMTDEWSGARRCQRKS